MNKTRYVHMAFTYNCQKCGEKKVMWVEKGLEEACNPRLKEKSGLPHKPTPFVIGCPVCGGFMQHCGGNLYLPVFIPARKGMDLFINSKKNECGKPVFNWGGK